LLPLFSCNAFLGENTWEPVENLECSEKIADFEAERERAQDQVKDMEIIGDGTMIKDANPVAITGCVKLNGVKHCICDFGNNRSELVDVKILRKKCPDMLLDALENFLVQSISNKSESI